MQSLISNLIRPFRFRYSIFDLGAKYNEKYERNDSSILNDRGFKIQYSYYKNKKSSDICFVYAHCNSGCRVEGLQFIQSVIDQGWNLCLFDFVGSGISEGEYISLGYYESMDLQTIISFLLKQGNSKIHLWGRSMGAATIILYLSQTKQIDAIVSCVLDSPYCSLWKVIKEFGKSKIKIPEFIIEHLMEFIRKNIVHQHQFDIKELQLVRKIHKIDIPIMFIASTNDSFVNFSHATELYKWANSKVKILQYIEKQHNSPRQSQTIEGGLAFMIKSLYQKDNHRQQRKNFSKKKQFCRKMTGHNMAQLIHKSPNKKQIKGKGSISSGNLTRFTSFCSLEPKNKQKIDQKRHSVQKDIFQLNIGTQRYGEQKDKQVLNSFKNPHILKQSIIKLALPQEIYQNLNYLNHNKQSQIKHDLQFKTLIKNINIVIEPKISKQAIRNNNLMQNLQNHKQIKDNFSNANTNANQNKQNNFNLNNNCSNCFQQGTPSSSLNIKNISSIMIKKFNFEQNNTQKQKGIQRLQKAEVKKGKSQKINMLHLKERKSADLSSNANKQSGIKLFTKITAMAQRHHHNVSAKQDNSQSSDEKIKTKRQRIKTQTVQIKDKNFEQSEQQIDFQEQITKQKNMRKDSTKMQSSYSNISIEVQQKHLRKQNFSNRHLCSTGMMDNQIKRIKCTKIDLQNIIQPNINIKRCGNQLNHLLSKPYNHQINVNSTYMNKSIDQKRQKNQQTISAISFNEYQSQNKKGNKMEKIIGSQNYQNVNLSRTHKIIKIQLDKNLIQEGNSHTIKKSEMKIFYPNLKEQSNKLFQPSIKQNTRYHANQFENNHSCIPEYGFNHTNVQINPTYSKVKIKNKKLLKINAIQISNNSFL